MSITHLHLMFTHVPVLGTIFGLALLAFAVWSRNEILKRVAFVSFVLSGLVAVGVYLTGEPTEHSLENVPGVAKSVIERHEDAAGAALASAISLAVISAAGAVIFRKLRPIPNWFASLVLAVSVVTSGFMAWTANLGGQVRHTEIQSGTALIHRD